MHLPKNIKIPVAVIAVSFLMFACAKKNEEIVSAGATSGKDMSLEDLLQIKQEVYSFRVQGFNKNKKVQWNLEGESANVVLDKININNLKVVYHGDDEDFTVSADKAVYDKKTQDIELKENIIGRSTSGGELFTTFAKWNAKTEEITSDAYVFIKRQNMSCEGKGIMTKPRLKWAIFKKDVEVNIEPGKKITCNGPFELDHEKSRAVFNGNVKVADKDSETFADKMTVYLNPDTNEVDRIITEGNVRVVHAGDIEKIGEVSFN